MSRVAFGTALVVLGVVLVALHRPLGALQARSQPAWMHPWPRPERVSGIIVLTIGIGVAVSGAIQVMEGLR